MGERQYSPEFEYKLTATATRTKSFAQGAEVVAIWSNQSVASRHLGRVVEDVGRELVELRDREVDDFTHHRRHPEGDDPQHELAAVFVDGGRVQIRDQTSGLGPGVHDGKWREDKIGRLQTMTTSSYEVDPCPETPKCFLQPLLDQATSSKKSRDENTSETAEKIEAILSGRPPVKPPEPKWQPKPLERTCVATMERLDEFRWMVQAEAKKRHFFTAKKRAFVADGASGNWTLRERHFPDFVPILDFAHAAEYMHAAAKVIGAASLGVVWVHDLWQGRSDQVIAELRTQLDLRHIGEKTLDEKHEHYHLQRAWIYLTNAADKLDYPRYRREGLPTTSSLVESQIKEFNARIKGTEKFWNASNAEAMLQLVGRTLNNTGPTLAEHFETRATSPFRRTYTDTIAA